MKSNKIPTVFSNPHFGVIRTAGTSENPMFCLADVCKALNLENNRNVSKRLEVDDVHTMDITDRLGRNQQTTFVTEQGLYDVILISRKPEAKAFRRWVTGDVLPSIRKTGKYSVNPEPERITYDALDNEIAKFHQLCEYSESEEVENGPYPTVEEYLDLYVDAYDVTNAMRTMVHSAFMHVRHYGSLEEAKKVMHASNVLITFLRTIEINEQKKEQAESLTCK